MDFEAGASYACQRHLAARGPQFSQMHFLAICKHKVLQILQYCFPNNYFGNFFFLLKFCNKLAKFIPSKACFMIIGNFKFVKSRLTNSSKQL